jgi:cytochrome b561
MQMSKYSRAQMILHWAIFTLIVVQFVFHEAIVVAFEALLDGKDTISNPMVSAHLGIGGLIGILTALRLWIRMEIGTPDEAGNNPKIFSHVAKFVHFSFYAILILLPITGGFAWYQTSQSAADTHTILRAILLLLILLHVSAVLAHIFVWRQNILKRMWPIDLNRH